MEHLNGTIENGILTMADGTRVCLADLLKTAKPAKPSKGSADPIRAAAAAKAWATMRSNKQARDAAIAAGQPAPAAVSKKTAAPAKDYTGRIAKWLDAATSIETVAVAETAAAEPIAIEPEPQPEPVNILDTVIEATQPIVVKKGRGKKAA